jgi:molybdate transport system substrate-binding protein
MGAKATLRGCILESEVVRLRKESSVHSRLSGSCTVRRANDSLLVLMALLCCVPFAGGCKREVSTTLTVSVAASLEGTIEDVEAAYRQEHGDVAFRNNFGSSGTLAREIEEGAPVDAFLSAAAGPMDGLAARGLLAAGSRVDVLQNSLVLIAPRDSKLTGFDGLTGSNVRLIALGDPASVPAGQYGKEVLDALHLYDKVKPKLVLGKDVRQVLTYVQTGNADAGLVYETDALSTSLVRVVAVAPASTHKPIVYPAAALAASTHGEQARAFIQFLAGSQAKAIFTRHGFTIATS